MLSLKCKNTTILSLLYLLFIINITVTAQEIPIIDWDKLSETKPWTKTEKWEPQPSITIPGNNNLPPSDAIVLFDGKSIDAFQQSIYPIGADLNQTKTIAHLQDMDKSHRSLNKVKWNIKSKSLEVNPGTGSIETKENFGSCQLHIEWLCPKLNNKTGQQYSNSGVFLMGLYEIQILNSYNNKTYSNGQAGSIYKQHPPLVNASRPPEQWQTYDIIFDAPQFDESGKLVKKAYITTLHNGILIQNHVELQGPTLYIDQAEYFPHNNKRPLVLQDHGDKVRFRNIWIRNL